MKAFLQFKHMRTIIILLLSIVVISLFNSCNDSDQSRKKILKIYNWADYIDEDLLTEFPVWYKEQTGEDVEIVYQLFDLDEVVYSKIALGREDFDLICPTQYIIERMMKNGLLLPIDKNFGNTPNYLDNISPFIRKSMECLSTPELKAEDYMVPYMWSTSGIMYNTNLIPKEEVETLDCFWNPKNKGKILMKDNYWDVYNIAAIHGFYSDIKSGKRTRSQVSNDHTDEDIAVVERELKKLKPNLAGWEADFGKDMMTKGEIWMNYAWSGDAVWAIEEAASVGVSLDYVIPREGCNFSFDGWIIPKYAGNVKAASYFLDFLCRPEVALRNMDVSGYCSAVATPEIIDSMIDTTLTEKVNVSYFFGPGHDCLLLNPVQYPDSSIISRCVLLNDFLDKNEQVLEMWSRAKGDNLKKSEAFTIFGSFSILAIWLVYRRTKKYFSKHRIPTIRH